MMATLPSEGVALATGSPAWMPALDRLLITLRKSIQATLAELEVFHELAGDVYPRALQDVSGHLNKINEAVDTLAKPSIGAENEGDVDTKGRNTRINPAMIERTAEVCQSHLTILRPLLQKYTGGSGSRAKNKLTARTVKELYQEQDIPKVQKGLSWCEQALTSQVPTTKRT